VLLDQYSELQFEGIATSDESWACYLIESDSMFARRREEVTPRFRSGISIKKIMMTADFTVRQLIAVNALSKGQKYNQEDLVQNIFRLCLMRRNAFTPKNHDQFFCAHG
jgi:hypothetical protein